MTLQVSHLGRAQPSGPSLGFARDHSWVTFLSAKWHKCLRAHVGRQEFTNGLPSHHMLEFLGYLSLSFILTEIWGIPDMTT